MTTPIDPNVIPDVYLPGQIDPHDLEMVDRRIGKLRVEKMCVDLIDKLQSWPLNNTVLVMQGRGDYFRFFVKPETVLRVGGDGFDVDQDLVGEINLFLSQWMSDGRDGGRATRNFNHNFSWLFNVLHRENGGVGVSQSDVSNLLPIFEQAYNKTMESVIMTGATWGEFWAQLEQHKLMGEVAPQMQQREGRPSSKL